MQCSILKKIRHMSLSFSQINKRYINTEIFRLIPTKIKYIELAITKATFNLTEKISSFPHIQVIISIIDTI
jgi:hypothetical protein